MDATTFTASDFFSAADFHALKPAILLCLFGCGILLTDAFFVRRTGKGWYNAITALVAEGTVMLAVLQHLGDVRSGGPLSALNGSILIDGFGVFFNIIFVLTRGGPENMTHLFSTLSYTYGLIGGQLGSGAAISLFLFPFMLVIVYFQLKLIRRDTTYD